MTSFIDAAKLTDIYVRAREILRYRLKRFDGQYLFPQNDIDGEQETQS